MSTIQLSTSRFGTIEVDKQNIIEFVSPILGFEQCKTFVLLDHADNSPFKWLQSTENQDLAFVVTNPKFFGIPYEFALPDDAVAKLNIQTAEDVIVFTIVNIPQNNPALMTANLLAPIVINQNNLQAMQVVLQDTQFNTRTRLLSDSALEKDKASQSSGSASGPEERS